MTREEAIQAFWDSVPEGATWIDLAEGMEITLPGGKTLATAASPGFRTRSMDHYQRRLEQAAVDLLCDDPYECKNLRPRERLLSRLTGLAKRRKHSDPEVSAALGNAVSRILELEGRIKALETKVSWASCPRCGMEDIF